MKRHLVFIVLCAILGGAFFFSKFASKTRPSNGAGSDMAIERLDPFELGHDEDGIVPSDRHHSSIAGRSLETIVAVNAERGSIGPTEEIRLVDPDGTLLALKQVDSDAIYRITWEPNRASDLRVTIGGRNADVLRHITSTLRSGDEKIDLFVDARWSCRVSFDISQVEYAATQSVPVLGLPNTPHVVPKGFFDYDHIGFGIQELTFKVAPPVKLDYAIGGRSLGTKAIDRRLEVLNIVIASPSQMGTLGAIEVAIPDDANRLKLRYSLSSFSYFETGRPVYSTAHRQGGESFLIDGLMPGPMCLAVKLDEGLPAVIENVTIESGATTRVEFPGQDDWRRVEGNIYSVNGILIDANVGVRLKKSGRLLYESKGVKKAGAAYRVYALRGAECVLVARRKDSILTYKDFDPSTSDDNLIINLHVESSGSATFSIPEERQFGIDAIRIRTEPGDSPVLVESLNDQLSFTFRLPVGAYVAELIDAGGQRVVTRRFSIPASNSSSAVSF